jgi:hypothetical protein
MERIEEVTGMRLMERDLKRDNSGKVALEKKIPLKKMNKKGNPEEKTSRGVFR